ncbi:MAG: hypothetical protein HZB71_06380 [Betaproteobacteria bacterium]|nr:hypothetical protein [Betaproteobacteria bacterium]
MAALPDDLLELGVKLCAVLSEEAHRYLADAAPEIRLQDADFTQVIDPANGLPGYEGVWRDARAQKCGSLTLNSDGSYYGEFDILTLHPRKPLWFIESVTVWGRDGLVKAEPRLLAAV